jgi:hypothetical protein
VILIGGTNSHDTVLNSCEIIDARGERGELLKSGTDFVLPKLMSRRSHHQSLIIEDKYLFIFFGKKTDTMYCQTLEFIDLENPVAFKEIKVT